MIVLLNPVLKEASFGPPHDHVEIAGKLAGNAAGTLINKRAVVQVEGCKAYSLLALQQWRTYAHQTRRTYRSRRSRQADESIAGPSKPVVRNLLSTQIV